MGKRGGTNLSMDNQASNKLKKNETSSISGICNSITVHKEKKPIYIGKEVCPNCSEKRVDRKNYSAAPGSFSCKTLYFIATQLLLLQSASSFETRRNDLLTMLLQQKQKNFDSSTYQTRLKRNPRSAFHCKPEIIRLTELAWYSYDIARKSEERTHSKRHTTRHTLESSPDGLNLRRLHERLKNIICDTSRGRNLFGHKTHEVKTALEAMVNLLQQEMNLLHIAYSNISRTSCSPSEILPIDSLRRKISNKLYSVQWHLYNYCTR